MKVFISVLFISNIVLIVSLSNLSAENPRSLEPVTFTTQEDHQQMLRQLGITRLRHGPSGNPDAPNAANYDEAKANPYPVWPEILRLEEGTQVSDAESWWNQRRPEIVDLFEREVYGRVPETVPSVTWTVRQERDGMAGDTPVTTQHIVGVVDNAACPEIVVEISMSLTLPKNAEGPVPILLMPTPPLTELRSLMPAHPSQAASASKIMMFGPTEFDPLPPWMRQFRGPRPENADAPRILSPTDELIAAGWGYVKINPSSIQADNGAGLTRGIIGLTNLGQPRKPDDWGSLRAWGWGASRGLDYLQTGARVDPDRVGIEGVSRYGKAALVTMAFDQRFAMVLVGSSGAGGATPHRRNFGEAVENLTGSGEYHWMAGNFMKYGSEESSFGAKNASDIPVDSHQLISLCAPRLTFISYGIPEKGDANWLDQRGSFMASVAADKVFRLLGSAGLGIAEDYPNAPMPAVNEGLLDGTIAWRQHDAGHTDASNMKYFIAWCEQHFELQAAHGARFKVTTTLSETGVAEQQIDSDPPLQDYAGHNIRTIINGGVGIKNIVVAAEASEGVRQAAEELATYLGRMSGADFQVVTGDGTTGIAVGVASDFPDLDHGVVLDTTDPLRRDDYLIRTHTEGAYVIGAGETGVTLAVWDLLHRLGYRLYFLTDAWEIVPDRPNLRFAVDVVERPDFVTREAPRGAPWSDRELWERWRRRNRVLSSFQLDTSHSYGRIISVKREQFDAHPEYFALVDGDRRSEGENAKLCISNPDLRQLVVEYTVETFRNDPDRDSISLDPSDGGGWCQCANCEAMGNVTDRVVILAGEAAEAINRLGLGPKYVGIYAYNQHSPPPTVDVHPQMIVSIATSFIRGGYTLEELIEGWRDQGAVLGIRDYHDVFTWSHDLPRKALGGDIDYLSKNIPYFYEQGARFMNSENSDSWGANGLGYWLTPQLLWSLEATDQVDELIEDFLQNCFGPAKEPMREFYDLLNRDAMVRSNEDVVARMYRRLDEARSLTDDEQIHRRLDDLILYARYLELYYAYQAAEGDERQQAFERIWRYAYRMRDRMIISTRAICLNDQFRDNSVVVPDSLIWTKGPDEDPWKSDDPFERVEIASILTEGILMNEPTMLDFELVEYDADLVPTASLSLPEVERGSYLNQFRGRQVAYTWLPDELDDNNKRQLHIEVTGGMIAHYRDRGAVNMALYAAREASLDPVAQDRSVLPDGEPRPIQLTSPYGGLHRLEWNDGNDMTRIVWPEDRPLTFRSTMDQPLRLQGRWSLLFYVPRGTRTVAGFATATTGRILDGNGNTVWSFEEMDEPDYFQVTVPEGQDATLWRFESCSGSRMLLTVPPYLAPSANDLLLPREVVEAEQ